MKALPIKRIEGQRLVPCEINEATHVCINIPGPTGQIILPFILKGKREGTGCWTWNGDTEKPTLRPSVKHTSGHYTDGEKPPCWCDYNKAHPDEKIVFICYACHTWINDGNAVFLPDSTHDLKNQTIPLLEVNIDKI